MSNLLDIITCPQWGAVAPKQDITLCGKSVRILIHGTDGHHPEISNPADESVEECMRFARDIQHFHMDVRGWTDSGHNFLVCRSGRVLQGRWMTVSAIQHGRMVESAHCPGQNTNVGIEHEHKGTEPMTPAQREASATLIAWIGLQYHRKTPLPLAPHRQFFNTACPVNLVNDIPALYQRAKQIMAKENL